MVTNIGGIRSECKDFIDEIVDHLVCDHDIDDIVDDQIIVLGQAAHMCCKCGKIWKIPSLMLNAHKYNDMVTWNAFMYSERCLKDKAFCKKLVSERKKLKEKEYSARSKHGSISSLEV